MVLVITLCMSPLHLFLSYFRRSVVFSKAAQRKRAAFSLTELLMVMAVISILMSVGLRTIASASPQDQDAALIEVGDALEAARQLAISQNTYTYVGFTSPSSPQAADSALCVAVFQSHNGEDVVRNARLSGGALLDEAAASQQREWLLVRKPKWLRNAIVESTVDPDPDLVPSTELSGGKFSNTVRPLPGGIGFRLTRKMGNMTAAAPLLFDRVITYSPNGTAYVDNLSALPEAVIGVLVRPSRGTVPSETERYRTAALTVSGLLGSTQVHKLTRR